MVTGVHQVTRAEFLSTMGTSAAAIFGVVVFVAFARSTFPLVYQGEMKDVEVEGAVKSGRFAWVFESFGMSAEEIARESGLDCGMFIAFLDLALQVWLYIGLPLFLLLAPIHYTLGGDAAGDRSLARIGLANVRPDMEDNRDMIYALHAVLVWYVVWMAMRLIWQAQAKFVDSRKAWLHDCRYIRAHTVLVEDIPSEYRTEEGVIRYFDEEVFARKVVREVWVVRDTFPLTQTRLMLMTVQQGLDYAALTGGMKVTLGTTPLLLMRQKEQLEERLEEVRERTLADPAFCTGAAFVTFWERRDVIMAYKVFSEDDGEEITVSPAPLPDDLRWSDLQMSTDLHKGRESIAHLLIGIMYLTFLPTVAFIHGSARLEHLSVNNPMYFVEHEYPWIAAVWNGAAGSIALSIAMSIVPIFFAIIIDSFIKIRSNSEVQLWMHRHYFTFLMVFVVLVSAIGNNIVDTAQSVLKQPLGIFALLAQSLPNFATFYVNYMLVQMITDAIALLRISNLGKFLFYSKVMKMEPQRAKEFAEPEDYVSQGMGARSARMMLLVTLPLLFVSVNPLVSVFSVLNFLFNRMVYCYLFMYAESTKPDLGGEFWVCQLNMMQWVLVLYVFLMAGKLYEASGSIELALVAGSSLVYWFYVRTKFARQFRFWALDFKDVQDGAVEPEDVDQMFGVGYPYRQKELDSATTV